MKVDLSEEQLKFSEATNAALSNRNGVMNQRVITTQGGIRDTLVDESKYGVAFKRGNFRKTQEDRVSK